MHNADCWFQKTAGAAVDANKKGFHLNSVDGEIRLVGNPDGAISISPVFNASETTIRSGVSKDLDKLLNTEKGRKKSN